MGTIGRESIVKTFDGLLNMFFRNGYFCQPGINFLNLVVNGREPGLLLFPFRPGESHGLAGLGGF